MAQPLTVQNNFSAGMKRDFPRNRMPVNSLWNAVDVILNYGAPVRSRGGWVNHSQDIASITAAAATRITSGMHGVFSTSTGASLQKNIAIDEDGAIYDVTVANAATLISAGSFVLTQNPVFHGGTAASAATPIYTGLMIFPRGNGYGVPGKYNGTTFSNLGGSPPWAKRASVYKDYTVLGDGKIGSTIYPNRVWFSPPGDPDVAVSGAVTAWDTTDSWIDFSQPIKGFGATKNALLVYGDTQIARVRGSTPPPDEDMVVDDPLFGVGLFDAFSIVEHKDSVYWCAPEGVFRSDGVVLEDITKKGGMLRYWLDLSAQSSTNWRFSAGIIRDTLFISILNGTSFLWAFMIDLQTYAWTRLSNLDSASFWSGSDGLEDELYFGRSNAARVCRASTMFSVGSELYKNDGNGVTVQPQIETPFYEFGKPGLKRMRRLFLGYEMTDYATDNPILSVYYNSMAPESIYDYTNIGDFYAEGTTYQRKKIPINNRSSGVSLKIEKSLAGDFKLHDIGFEIIKQEESK